MIAGSLILVAPFAEPGLIWRELRFIPADLNEMATSEDPLGPVRVTLASDLSEAVAKRRTEFLAGRLCAAMALRWASLPTEVARQGRAPVWPSDVAGSITHSDNRAIAVISRHHVGLGVDCETMISAEQAENLHPEIITPTEAALRPALLPFSDFLTLAFSAKESLYKALSSRLLQMPGFHDVTLVGITDDQAHLAFAGTTYRAQFRVTAQDCVTLVAIRA
ncbi:4'-phosphopantetheinyl transferase [Cypionkella sp.]|uniref:4'-phosphopantetheinyl transferase family protein n=1 Tax=Cypionkella sp. TaxID=2811411 RepID=UPI00263792B1|nr:4'-phosphopantetheinyl transferase superfamily protein [Cypionkella sp.]MDB5665161.1 4-phosphopantetheinyl transferase superfamily protein [Cypionkella sp.]